MIKHILAWLFPKPTLADLVGEAEALATSFFEFAHQKRKDAEDKRIKIEELAQLRFHDIDEATLAEQYTGAIDVAVGNEPITGLTD